MEEGEYWYEGYEVDDGYYYYYVGGTDLYTRSLTEGVRAAVRNISNVPTESDKENMEHHRKNHNDPSVETDKIEVETKCPSDLSNDCIPTTHYLVPIHPVVEPESA